jgi:pimeloyl-ACP methyl ester carboxylesterase
MGNNIVASKAFLPPPSSYDEQLETLVWATSSLGDRIPCIFLPHHSPRFTILFSHGNAEDIGQINEWLAYISRLFSVSVLSYDYRGYGLHEGEPTESSCYADIEAAYGLLTQEMGIPASRIILYGRSIGSGPTCYLAQRLCEKARPRVSAWSMLMCSGPNFTDETDAALAFQLPAGLILQSPIASAIRVVSKGLAMAASPLDIFPNINRIDKILIPTLIVHGKVDEVVPYWHGAELYAKAARGYKLLSLEYAGHNNIESDFSKDLCNCLGEFLQYLASQAGQIRDDYEEGQE